MGESAPAGEDKDDRGRRVLLGLGERPRRWQHLEGAPANSTTRPTINNFIVHTFLSDFQRGKPASAP